LVSKRFRVCSHDQPFLLPPSLQDWLPENHLARFVAEVINELDLSSVYASYERCDGRDLVKLGNVSIYGTKIKANASAWRSMNYQKVSEREQHWRAEVLRLLSQAQQTDREEDQRLGSAPPGDRLLDELANAQKRL
jgi:hypothetical protein